jgi:valyl-tRNA synthetase
LKKLVDTELNEITLSKVELYEEYEKKRKKLEKERSVKCLKERISLYAGRLKIFIPKDSFLQFEKKNKDIKEKETKETILFLKREIARCEKLLSDEGFKQKAPKELIEKETKKLTKLRTYYEKLKSEV